MKGVARKQLSKYIWGLNKYIHFVVSIPALFQPFFPFVCPELEDAGPLELQYLMMISLSTLMIE